MKNKISAMFRAATENLGDAIIPKKFRKNIRDYFRKAGINDVPYFNLGFTLYIIIFISFIIQTLILRTSWFKHVDIGAKIFLTVIFVPILLLLLLGLALFSIMLYLDVLIKIRVNDMEDNFPEFLSNLALNFRINGTLEAALENSATKELGVLSEEIHLVIKDIRMGNTEDQAIRNFMNKYKSDTMNDSFELILLSWKKGGNSALLVERLYENMKSLNFLKDKIMASITSYRIFLTSLALVIAPAMFALTYHLIDLIRRISTQVASIPENANLAFSINAIKMNDSEFLLFATLCVVIISIAIAFIMSIVKTGKGSYAFKQMLLYAILSILSFNIFMFIFKIFFSMFLI